MAMVTPRRLVWVVAGLAAVGVLVVYSGTLIESHWTGATDPCERFTTLDNSTWQQGSSSMRWLPPLVRCEFVAIHSDDAVQRFMPAEETDEFAVYGIVLTGFIAMTLAFMVAVVAVVAIGGSFMRRSRQAAATKVSAPSA